ncbi:endonuclease [Umezawaea tangerina]|uniref:Endonuclease I n=1 Tax=Umezawaea tangerina TaxID=84725 RepID=A0A2T0T995_9PSEU|nr:endonuclease [Umezawaea tangerina]PRY42257.1 endonuclease I [Umezawaea tangerina]
MPRSRAARWSAVGLFVVATVVAVAVQVPTATAATPITVAQAIGQQTGASATVRGYVVGQPTATSTVIRSGFPNDYALALADSASETATSKMVYVQITSSFRAAWGLQSNPSLLGKQLDVTGPLGAYFSHAGLTSPTAFALAGGGGTTPPTTTPPTGTPGDYDGTYYLPAIGKSGTALRTSLNQIIRTQTKLTYEQVWDALKLTDQDPNNSNNVILLYSGTSRAKSLNGGNPDDWNREHVWAKSHGDFGTATGPGTDIHHLRPADVTVNSDRGNKDFDNGGTQSTEAPGNYTDADSWEPRNADKGDVARMIFYMAIRYEGGDGFPDLEVNNSTSNGTNPYIGKLSVLKQWNTQDPPSTFEKRRNQVIYDTFQHNRNPFIDHPEWVDSIWG